jgi:hypothetical protein
LNLLNNGHDKQFINHSDYCVSLALACGQVHWRCFFPGVAVIAAAVAAYPVAVYSETPGGLVAMSADLAFAYCHYYSVAEAACESHMADLCLDYHLADRALKYPAAHAVLIQVAEAFDPDLPDVIAAVSLVMTVEHLCHVSAALQIVAVCRNLD